VDKLLAQIKDGVKDINPLVNFITKLQGNPSSNSISELYSFLSYRELPITPEGNVLGYKYVRNDYYSVHGNKNTRVLQGKVDEGGRIYNGIGEVIEVNRADVDDNLNNHCSHGLHIGSFDYANISGYKMLVVEFDPTDAVSVPNDCNFQKLRVCKYKVISEVTDNRVEIEDSVYSDNDDYDPRADSCWDEEEAQELEDACSGECDGRSCGSINGINYDFVIEDQATLNRMEDYIENRHLDSNGPSIKEVQSRMKGYPLSSQVIYHTAKWMGYNVDEYDTSRNTIIRE